MRLSKGTRLGPYLIERSLGAGGMGEVYCARDTRLARNVAIKTLPAHFAQDARLKLRLEREAKAISALNHPHICALYDIGHADGVDFLVMELLEGETLAERLQKRRLSLEEVLRIGVDVADALEKAHRTGIVHRDLKPANVMLTASGAKLLDFGLARDVTSRPQADVETAARTEAEPVTREGAVLGTLHFMAPEQVEGRSADQRSDIFALGNLLYMMVTGHAPFGATSDAGVIAAILQQDPPSLRSYRPDVPAALERLIDACLKKDPEQRIQSAHDVKLQLEWIAAALGEKSSAQPAATRKWPPAAWIIAGVAVVLAAAWAYWLSHRQNQTHVRRFSIQLPPPAVPFEAANHEFAISPNGTLLVVSLTLGRGRQLYMRSFDRFDLVPLPGTEGGINPFFSPDGKWVGFAARGKLQKLLLGGGPPVMLCDAPRSRGATWSADGTIVFAPLSEGDGLYRVSADGGQPVRITELNKSRGDESHRWPRFLPDGQHVLFTLDDWAGTYAHKRIGVVDLKSGAIKILLDGGTDAHYIPGFLIFARERTLYAQRFDVKHLQLSGLAMPVLEPLVTHAGMGSAQTDLSDDGVLVYLPYDPIADQRELVWVDRGGAAQPVSPLRQPYETPRLSPDDRQLLVTVGEPRSADLWLLDIASNSWSRIAPDAKSLYPLWSRDGHTIFFSSNRSGFYNIYSMRSDGTGPARQLSDWKYWPFPRSVSPDGRVILADEQHPVTAYNIWAFRTDGGAPTPVVRTKFDEMEPDFSPDGRWFAYTSSESGSTRIYVQAYPPSGRKWAVSEDGARNARWSRNGRELFFRVGRKMVVAPISTAPALSVGQPSVLFEGDYAIDYDLASDGKRFLMMRDDVRRWEAPALAVVVNWQAEVPQRLAAP